MQADDVAAWCGGGTCGGLVRPNSRVGAPKSSATDRRTLILSNQKCQHCYYYHSSDKA
jgi:hypothetical protein